MKLDIVFDQASLKMLAAAFGRIPEITQTELRRFMHSATQFLQGEVVERTPAAEGTLRGSIIAGVRELPGDFLGTVGTSLSYAEAVELGTKAHMPPIEPLEQWVRTKIGLSGKKATAMARGIQWKIYHHGTKGAFMFRDAVKDNKAEVERQFAATVARIANALTASFGNP